MKLPLIESVNKSVKDKGGSYGENLRLKFKQFISQNNLSYEEKKCLCNADNPIVISKKDEYGLYQENVMCGSCGLIYANPRLSEKSYQKFYSSNFYREIYDESSDSEKRLLKTPDPHIFQKVNDIYKINPKTNVLDFGCGAGWNLKYFKDAGAICSGIDYSYFLVNLGIKHGYSLKQGGLDEVEGKFDVIILNHVYEHFLNPIDDLKKLSNHLAPNGIIYIEVPNIYNFSASQMHIPHTYCFSPDTFPYYVQKSNMKILDFGSAGNGYHMYGVFKKSSNKGDLPIPSFDIALREYKRFIFKEKMKIFLRNIKLFDLVKRIYFLLFKNKY